MVRWGTQTETLPPPATFPVVTGVAESDKPNSEAQDPVLRAHCGDLSFSMQRGQASAWVWPQPVYIPLSPPPPALSYGSLGGWQITWNKQERGVREGQ